MGTTYYQPGSKTPKKTANIATRTNPLQRSRSDCPKKRKLLQRRAVSQSEPAEVPPIVHEVLRSPGSPLDAATRSFMESRFSHDFSRVRPHTAPQAASLTIAPAGDSYEHEADQAADKVIQRAPALSEKGSVPGISHDFGKVRVHTGSKAAESARALGAHAYTVDQSIVFGEGQYAPETRPGQRLLAHELAHVIQQTATGYTLKALQRDINPEHHLQSKCFAGDETLEDCYNGKHRMTVGEPDHEAVKKVQRALIAILNQPMPKSTECDSSGNCDTDGKFGGETEATVASFKRQQPDLWQRGPDGVVGAGTMERLDEFCRDTSNIDCGNPPILKMKTPTTSRSCSHPLSEPVSETQTMPTTCWAAALVSFMKTRNLAFPPKTQTEGRPTDEPWHMVNYYMWTPAGAIRIHNDGTPFLNWDRSLPHQHTRDVLRDITGSGLLDWSSGAAINNQANGGKTMICERLDNGKHILAFQQLGSNLSWDHTYVVYDAFQDFNGHLVLSAMDPATGSTKASFRINDSDNFWLVQR
jgi:hypothetical protein